jgi:hypothetical protein
MVLERHRGMVVIRRSKREWEAWEQLKHARHEEFSVACVTCASILLRHAAYSHLLVSLLVRQISDYAIQYPLFDLESSFIPYLQVSHFSRIRHLIYIDASFQRFEAVIDQPLALKLRDAGWLGSTASHDTQGSISIPVSP